ncbi:hypothetical protein EDC24_1358 [Aquisalibacillus elongatus]|uniref:Uncharacterized protein n=1 Tax=Aquisalibacillus elongatus TaxID=485577 RepID=A0A3N5B8V1_9BACI|nr:hypothetical protein EDC24_1358 [Aquisalibacillus elongatus]
MFITYIKDNLYSLLSLLLGVFPSILLSVLVTFQVTNFYWGLIITTLFFTFILVQLILLVLGYRHRSNKVMLFIGLLIFLYNMLIILSLVSLGFY